MKRINLINRSVLSIVLGIGMWAYCEAQIEPAKGSMTPEQMMSYLPKHQAHVPYSWDTPRDMRCVRGKGGWESVSDEIVDTYAQVGNSVNCGTEAQKRMVTKYPNKFYSGAYMNLGKEFSGKDAADKNPEYYVYKKDGTLYLNGRYPYFNFKVPECRAYWHSEARRQIDMEPKPDFFFIDGFAKAVAVSQDDDSFYDYWGKKIGPEYLAEGVDPLLAAARDDFADEVIIAGNIWRPANIWNFSDDFNPDNLLDYVMKYTHLAYFEFWESGGKNAEIVNNSLAHLQKITESGRMIRLTLGNSLPATRSLPLTLEEMRNKAQEAMPDLWEKLDSEERDELASSYAYFDVKLAYFLIGAGEYSYLQFDTPPRIIEAGTDMWRIKQPFPEYDMPLGKPLGRAQKNGNIWTRKFEHVEVVLDVGNGTVEYRKVNVSPNLEGKMAKPLKGSRPNIIFVLTDDQGMGDLSCMGNPILKTPHLDRFHERATRFTDYHVSPTCSPTRSAIMSGRAPFKNGVTHTISRRERMALDVFTLPQALQSAGYKTGHFGKWHLGEEDAYLPQNRGFDEVLMRSNAIRRVLPPNNNNRYFDNVLLHNDTIVQTKGFCTDLLVQSALAWIKKQHEAKVPYFAYIPLNAPHGPYNTGPFENRNRFLEAGYDEKTASRYGMIENIDDNFGRLMAYLEEWQALENTLVIFMTDNGMSMPPIEQNGITVPRFNAGLNGFKNSPYEGGTRVPAFWYWKGVLGEGIDIPALTAHIDLYRTFSELAGVELPEQMQGLDGRSLLPLLEDPKADWPDRKLFVHCGRWDTGKRDSAKYEKCAVRTEQWRFVNNSELYNIFEDPGEQKNVAALYPEVLEELRRSYDIWWTSVLPFMINEGLPKVNPKDHPLAKRYYKQLEEQGIPEWAPSEL